MAVRRSNDDIVPNSKYAIDEVESFSMEIFFKTLNDGIFSYHISFRIMHTPAEKNLRKKIKNYPYRKKLILHVSRQNEGQNILM